MTKLIALDTETTGLLARDKKTDALESIQEHRIVELYMSRWDVETETLEEVLELRIDPERSMPNEAYRIHGIAHMDLIGKPKMIDVGAQIVAFLDTGDVYLAHNGDGFDLPFLRLDLDRFGFKFPEKPSIDSQNATWATPSGKKCSLEEFCLACDVEYDRALAHGASYDVSVMVAAFFNAYRWGFMKISA